MKLAKFNSDFIIYHLLIIANETGRKYLAFRISILITPWIYKRKKFQNHRPDHFQHNDKYEIDSFLFIFFVS